VKSYVPGGVSDVRDSRQVLPVHLAQLPNVASDVCFQGSLSSISPLVVYDLDLPEMQLEVPPQSPQPATSNSQVATPRSPQPVDVPPLPSPADRPQIPADRPQIPADKPSVKAPKSKKTRKTREERERTRANNNPPTEPILPPINGPSDKMKVQSRPPRPPPMPVTKKQATPGPTYEATPPNSTSETRAPDVPRPVPDRPSPPVIPSEPPSLEAQLKVALAGQLEKIRFAHTSAGTVSQEQNEGCDESEW